MNTRMLMVPAFLAVLSLTACNAGEDFGDAILGGPVITPDPSGPIPEEDSPALEVELVAAVNDGGTIRTAQVANLAYRCSNAFGRITGSGEKAGLARCDPATRSVEFYIGGDAAGERRISLGTAFVPLCTGRALGSGQGGVCQAGAGFFQVTVADLVPFVPAQGGNPLPLSAPARRSPADDPALRRAALLSALDSSANPLQILIPNAAYTFIDDAPEDSLFDEGGYDSFLENWQDWFALLAGSVAELRGLPATSQEAEDLAVAATSRTRAGLYSLEHDGILYGGTFRTRLFPTDPLGTFTIVIPLLVTPDGTALGVGGLLGTQGGAASIESAVDLVALNAGSRLNDSLSLTGDGGTGSEWTVRSVLDSTRANVDFAGRVIGAAVYDNVAPLGTATDYYRDFTSPGIYVMKPADRGRFSGSLLGKNYEDVPYRIGRTAYVSAVLHPTVMTQLPEFYQLGIYKACVDPADFDSFCSDIPAEEIGAGLNYPIYFDNDNCDPRNPDPTRRPAFGSCSDTDPAINIDSTRKERLRGGAGYVFASGRVNVQFLADGRIVTDSRRECRALDEVSLERDNGDGGVDQEKIVGFVSRTFPANQSANVLMFFSGPADFGTTLATQLPLPPMPHYGTQIQGRLNLAAADAPLLRLGDENFDAGIRAFWQDFYQAGRLASTPGLNATGITGHRIKALQSGAVSGVALDGTCTPVAAP